VVGSRNQNNPTPKVNNTGRIKVNKVAFRLILSLKDQTKRKADNNDNKPIPINLF